MPPHRKFDHGYHQFMQCVGNVDTDRGKSLLAALGRSETVNPHYLGETARASNVGKIFRNVPVAHGAYTLTLPLVGEQAHTSRLVVLWPYASKVDETVVGLVAQLLRDDYGIMRPVVDLVCPTGNGRVVRRTVRHAAGKDPWAALGLPCCAMHRALQAAACSKMDS